MRYHDIKCFIELAECLNYTVAAAHLYMSQPGLSKIISNMENELGIRLFSRNTRSVHLTQAGEQFLNICQGFTRQCEMLKIQNPQDSITTSGTLAIGLGDLFENRDFPKIVTSFHSRHPNCRLFIKRYTPEEVLSNLDNGSIDIGVMTTYAVPVKGYQQLVYRPSPLMLVVAPNHHLANRDRVNICELKDEKFIFIEQKACRGDSRIREVCSKGGFQPNIITETNSLPSLLALVASGVGIGLNFLMHKDGHDFGLRFIDLDLGDDTPTTPKDGAAFVWKKQNINPVLPLFLKCASSHSSHSE